MGKQIRIDIYYGFRDEGGPRDRHQIFYDVELDDLDDAIQVARNCFEDSIAELVNELEESDEGNEE